MKVKIIDVSGAYVSIRYMSSNARSRMKKDDFLKDYQTGIFDVKNPDALEIAEEVS